MVTQPDGSKVQGTVYNPGPETYEAELVPRIFRPWAERLVDSAGLQPGEQVLDLACGTGIVARTAAGRVQPGGRVAGVDVNPAMLELARQVSDPGIEYVESNAEKLPFEDAGFDAVLCQQALQFFADRAAALREVLRVLTPGGRAVFAVWRGQEHHPVFGMMDSTMQQYLGEEAMQGANAPFWLGDIGEVRRLFTGAGFGDVHIVTRISEVRFPSIRRMVDALSGAHAPLAASVAGIGEERREAMYRALEQAVAGYLDDEGLVCPMASAVVVAKK